MLNKKQNENLNDTNTELSELEKEFKKLKKQALKLANPNHLNTVSLTELMDNIYQSKLPVIDNLLYKGLYIFAGAPKIGKSFTMAQLAFHVSMGFPLWGFNCRKSTVLYLALEDDYQRLQSRVYRMFGAESNDNLHFTVRSGQLDKGLNEQLQNFISEHPDTSLIIIDTLQKVREMGDNSYSYTNDYQIIAKLKAFCETNNVAMVLVHHTRKQNADDKFDMISGTNGLLGASDGAFILTKEKRTSDKAVLDISGRDQQEQRLHLIRNEETLAWELENLEKEMWKEPPEPILNEIAELVTDLNPTWEGTPSELSAVLKTKIKPHVLTPKLNVLASRLFREHNVSYEHKRSHEGRKIILKLCLP